MANPEKTEPKAPKFLEISITDPEGKLWGKLIAQEKIFSSGLWASCDIGALRVGPLARAARTRSDRRDTPGHGSDRTELPGTSRGSAD